ncbi:RRQRL motif-containing zinc-binding protein [Nocardia fluminea]|uniref:RRQRL motif-containing zinc-binding protein n=1 Tax=Nocardia fluminea TaxID=134984 RepID=UPI00364C6514
MIGGDQVRARDLPDPDGSRYGVPTYYWGTAPEGLATRRQLRAMGLRPNGQDIAAQAVRPRRAGRTPLAAYFYRVALAAPKRTATPAQLESVARATRVRQERAMARRCVEVPEMTEAPAWDGWGGFDR